MIILLFLFWTAAAALVGFIGSDRTLGFWGSFLISLIFSPVIGIIAVLLSNSRKKSEEEALLRKKQLEALSTNSEISASDEIIKLKKLFDEGVISDEEFQDAKNKLLKKIN